MMSEDQQQPMECKTIKIAGFTEAGRKQELDRKAAKLAADGWTLKEYNDKGMSGSEAIFSRPLTARVRRKSEISLLKKVGYGFGGVIVFLFVGGLLADDEPKGAADNPVAQSPTVENHAEADLGLDLKGYQKLSDDRRQAAVAAFVASNGIAKEQEAQVYNFLSEAAMMKSQELKVSEVLGWAKAEMDKNGGKLRKAHYNLDSFTTQFSPWDGSHRKLEKFIKTNMNDPDSYDHAETRYRLVLSGQDAPYAMIYTTFRGKNGFGGIVKNTISAKVDITTGDILQVMQ
jgi:hypothetical protein